MRVGAYTVATGSAPWAGPARALPPTAPRAILLPCAVRQGVPHSCGNPTCCSGTKSLNSTGNFYLSGELSVAVAPAPVGGAFGIELIGKGTFLTSTRRGGGFVMSVAGAPNISLSHGAIVISLGAAASVTSSMYFNFTSNDDYTIAHQSTMELSPGDFVGAIVSMQSPPRSNCSV